MADTSTERLARIKALVGQDYGTAAISTSDILWMIEQAESVAAREPDVYIRVGDDLMIEEVCSLKGGEIPPGEHRYFAGPQAAYCCSSCGMPDTKTMTRGQDGIAGSQSADVIAADAMSAALDPHGMLTDALERAGLVLFFNAEHNRLDFVRVDLGSTLTVNFNAGPFPGLPAEVIPAAAIAGDDDRSAILPVTHAREIVAAQDAARGNFRNNDHQNDGA